MLATRLSINYAGEIYRNPQALSRFANHLLILRDQTPLHECEINLYYAVSCQVQVLWVLVINELHDLRLSDVSLLTQRLTKLELCSTKVGVHFLDFSSCPALKVLKMKHCPRNAARILSQSLSHLIINYGNFISVGRTRISSYFLFPLFLCMFLQGWFGCILYFFYYICHMNMVFLYNLFWIFVSSCRFRWPK
jgi:hypothetical protein